MNADTDSYTPGQPPGTVPIDKLPRQFRNGDVIGEGMTYVAANGLCVCCVDVVSDALLYMISGGARGWTTFRNTQPLELNTEQQLELIANIKSDVFRQQRSAELRAELVRQGEMAGPEGSAQCSVLSAQSEGTPSEAPAQGAAESLPPTQPQPAEGAN